MAESGIGVTLKKGTNTTPMSDVFDITFPEWESEALETSTLGDADSTATTSFGSKTFIPNGQSDPGEITVELRTTASLTNFTPNEVTTWTVSGEKVTVAGSGFITRRAPGKAELAGVINGTVVIKCSGAWTVTTAS